MRIILFFSPSIYIVLLLFVACQKVLPQLVLKIKYSKFWITATQPSLFLLFISSQTKKKAKLEKKAMPKKRTTLGILALCNRFGLYC